MGDIGLIYDVSTIRWGEPVYRPTFKFVARPCLWPWPLILHTRLCS